MIGYDSLSGEVRELCSYSLPPREKVLYSVFVDDLLSDYILLITLASDRQMVRILKITNSDFPEKEPPSLENEIQLFDSTYKDPYQESFKQDEKLDSY